MSTVMPRNNGEFVQPFVDRAKTRAVQLADWARAHPDEAALAIAPTVLVVAATTRHEISFTEAAILSQVGYWCGVLAVKAYRDWKARPAGPALRSVV